MDKLKRLRTNACIELREAVEENFELYTSENFEQILSNVSLKTEMSLKVDLKKLAILEPEKGKEIEAKNSKLVFDALPEMTPRLARDEGVWTNLCHGPCLEYARKRWLVGVADDKLATRIRAHFFANTLNRCRDDNAIARLWWNGYIASIASPNDILLGLDAILSTADIRASFVERSQITSWPKISQGIVRHMRADPWVIGAERNFREFMITVNFVCGGMLLEGINNTEIDRLMAECSIRAKRKVALDQKTKKRKKTKPKKKVASKKKKRSRKH